MKNTKPGPIFRKGDLVRISKRAAALMSYQRPNMRGYPSGFYLLNAEDRQEWHSSQKKRTDAARAAGEDTFSINFDSAGESRLAPRQRLQTLDEDGIYQVLRGRCRVEYNWRMLSGRVLILDTTTGRELYCERDILERVDKRD